MIDDALRSFMHGQVTQTAAAVDAGHRAAVARCAGVLVAPAGDRMQVMLSEWQWPQLVANLRLNGRMALTFMSPVSYVSYQVKGRATVEAPGPEERAASERYLAGMAALLPQLRLPSGGIRLVSSRELVVAALRVEEIYVQTPGPGAGRPLGMPP